MNLRTITLLVAALSAASLTAYFANSWLAAQRAAMDLTVQSHEAPADVAAAEILVAKDDLAIGTFVKPELLTWQVWPEEGLKEGYIVRGSQAEKDLEGAVVRSHLFAGEPITNTRVVHPGERGFLAAVLEPGKRAVSVPVDATKGISGFVFPGDAVDVLLTFRTVTTDESVEDASKNATRHFSETLLDSVRVLAIDQAVENVDGTAKVAKTATLEVTPKQAEKISIAMEIGTLSLSLRSLAHHDDGIEGIETAGEKGAVNKPDENRRSYTRDVDVYYMIGDPLGIPDPNALSRTVTVMRGNETGKVRF